MTTLTEYTFTFDPKDEGNFRRVLSRLEPEEYNILEEVRPVDHKEDADLRYVDRQMIIEMEEEAALTFRLGMKHLKIRRKRTEEELAEEKALHDANTIKVTVRVDGLLPPTGTTP
jgi:hypothetical protein